jgi:hypothetical protein
LVVVVADLFDFLEQERRTTAARDAQVTEATEGKVARDPAATSARAARSVEPRTGTQRGRVLSQMCASGGATDFELVRHLGLLDSSVRPRRGELVDGGYVADSGRTRECRGSDWTVWQATEDGLSWHRRQQIAGAA